MLRLKCTFSSFSKAFFKFQSFKYNDNLRKFKSPIKEETIFSQEQMGASDEGYEEYLRIVREAYLLKKLKNEFNQDIESCIIKDPFYMYRSPLAALKKLRSNLADKPITEEDKDNEFFLLNLTLNLDFRRYDHNTMMLKLVYPHYNYNSKLTVLGLTLQEEVDEALAQGADLIIDGDIYNDIMNGNFNFDAVLATPNVDMGELENVLNKAGFILSKEEGTLIEVQNFHKAIDVLNRTEYAVPQEKDFFLKIGSSSFSDDQLMENLEALINEIYYKKPKSVKSPSYILEASISYGEESVPLDVLTLNPERQNRYFFKRYNKKKLKTEEVKI